MERLTIDEVIEHCRKTCENTELMAIARGQEQSDITSKNYWEHYQVEEWLKELKQYREAEEQGLFLKLPCKVGDAVWLTDSVLKCVHPFEITEIRINKYESLLRIKYFGTEQQFVNWQIESNFSRLGDWFFKTKEEAEAKLKELQN